MTQETHQPELVSTEQTIYFLKAYVTYYPPTTHPPPTTLALMALMAFVALVPLMAQIHQIH